MWASRGTLEGLGINRRSHILKANQQQKIGDWLVKPFATIHDDKRHGRENHWAFLFFHLVERK